MKRKRKLVVKQRRRLVVKRRRRLVVKRKRRLVLRQRKQEERHCFLMISDSLWKSWKTV